MSIDTLKGLTLIENLDTPVPAAINTYIQTNLATGTGDFGVPTITDILGVASGEVAVDALNQTTSALNSIDLTGLKAVYDNMLACVQGTFGPVGGPIVIPSGPATGAYADADTAFTTGLIPAANTAIASLISTYPEFTSTMNSNFNGICQRIISEANYQSTAGINYDDVGSGPAGIYGFVSSLALIGLYSTPGGQYEYMMKIADTSIQSGQAIIGAIREGKNQSVLNEAGIPVGGFGVGDNWPGLPASTGVADIVSVAPLPPSATSTLGEPAAVPAPVKYQTETNPTSTSYTVDQARALAQSQLLNPAVPSTPVTLPVTAPEVVQIVEVYQQQASAQLPGDPSTTILQNAQFWIKLRVYPSDADTQVTLGTSAGVYVTYPGVTLNSGEGVLLQLPGWLVPTTGPTTLVATAGQPGGPTTSATTTVEVAVNDYPNSVTITQDGWFNSVNRTVYGNEVTVTLRGPPSETFIWGTTWTTTWPVGSDTFDSDGYAIYSGLSSPPISNDNQILVRYQSGEVVYTSFTTVPM